MVTAKSKTVLLLVKSALTGALGGLLFGFDTAVIAGSPTPSNSTTLSPKARRASPLPSPSTAPSSEPSSPAHSARNRQPRRPPHHGHPLRHLCPRLRPRRDLDHFLFFRFLGGLGIGGSSVLGPVYIAELSPAKWRGRLVGLFQINIVVGILLAYPSNAIIAHFQFGAIAVASPTRRRSPPRRTLPHPSLHRSPLLPLARHPKPPRRGLPHPRRPRLTRLRRRSRRHRRIHPRRRRPHPSTALFQRRYSKLIFLAITIGFFNQLSGINAILYYLNDIFASAGFNSVSGAVQAVVIGSRNLVATLLGISSSTSSAARPLLLIGAVGCCLSLFGVAWIFHTGEHLHLLLAAARRLHHLLRHLSGIRHLGLPQRSLPHQRPLQGPSLGSSSHWIANGLIANSSPTSPSTPRRYPSPSSPS